MYPMYIPLFVIEMSTSEHLCTIKQDFNYWLKIEKALENISLQGLPYAPEERFELPTW